MKALIYTASLAACLALVGCGMNFVEGLPQGGAPTEGSSVVVYGLRVAGKQPSFSMSLDAYNPANESADGNCFRWDRMRASILSGTTGTHYFSFLVRPGHYVYSPHQRPMKGPLLSFKAEPAATVFIGEFVLTPSNEVELFRDLAASKYQLLAALPKTDPNLALAQITPTNGVRLFLCGP